MSCRRSKIQEENPIGRRHLEVNTPFPQTVENRCTKANEEKKKKTYKSHKSLLCLYRRKYVLNFSFPRLVSSEPKETLYNRYCLSDDSTHYLLKIRSFYRDIVSASVPEKPVTCLYFGSPENFAKERLVTSRCCGWKQDCALARV